MTDAQTPALALASKLAALFAGLPDVEAIALGGSQSNSSVADLTSDIDLYVYTRADIPVAEREALILRAGGASRADVGLSYWGPGDEWFDATTGIEADVMYFDGAWMEGQLQRVIEQHQAQLGYTTCFWRTVRNSRIYYDPRGWFQRLQQQSYQPYPEALRRAIITFNRPVLRQIIPSYLHQVEKAVRRQDQVSVNHRVAALLASYFDILFALNRTLHPGEKRLIALAQSECARLPVDMEQDLQAVLRAAGPGTEQVVHAINRLLDRLDDLLAQEGF